MRFAAFEKKILQKLRIDFSFSVLQTIRRVRITKAGRKKRYLDFPIIQLVYFRMCPNWEGAHAIKR